MLQEMVITKILDVFTVNSPKGRHLDMHNRSAYGITFCYQGQITYTKSGIRVVSDRNHMVLLPQGQDYTLHGNEPGQFPVINIHCAPPFSVTEPTAFPLRDPEIYLREYERLRELFLLGNRQAECMSILYHILGELAMENIAGHDMIQAALQYIEQSYLDASISNSRIARQCNVSEVYFRKKFKESCGITPKQYILNLRMRKAKQLLSESQSSVGEIAETCGFTNTYHFSRAFHHNTGLSPTQYRQQSKKTFI